MDIGGSSEDGCGTIGMTCHISDGLKTPACRGSGTDMCSTWRAALHPLHDFHVAVTCQPPSLALQCCY
jgi:hypothetical protein